MPGQAAVELVKPPSAPGPIGRLDRLSAQIAALESELGGLRTLASGRTAASQAMQQLAQHAQAASRGQATSVTGHAASLVKAVLQSQLEGLTLPASPETPAISVVLSHATVPAVIDTLHAVAPGLAKLSAEILLADLGHDPTASLLAAHLQHLRVMQGANRALACNVCVTAARGEWIILLTPGRPSATEATLAALAARLRPNRVVVGRLVQDSLARHGVPLGPAAPGPSGLLLALPRALWIAASGLDPAFEDGGGLVLADLCLRLRLLGARLVPLDGGRAPDRAEDIPDAALAFRARWGDLQLDMAPA